jgi:glycosyltransferase involved in cell wall biosynthesis
MTTPIVTAIVSTYSAERFIKGCMDDLVAQTIFDKMEVLVIDSGSPESESRVCAEFAARYPDQIVLIRTEREPLYVAWNRGIKMARGRYLTNPPKLRLFSSFSDSWICVA